MPKNPRKKRIVLWILLIILLLLLTAAAIPVITLYVQYRSISYVPAEPIQRPDVYVLPDYPEVIPGSEGITDYPDEETEPSQTESGETESGETEPSQTESGETEPAQTESSQTVSGETSAPETLPPAVNPTPRPAQTGQSPPLNPNHSFAHSADALSVYGKTPIYKVEKIDKNLVNILILGTDSRDVVRDRGRSDTMLILSYNKKTGEIRMASLLRDLLVPIEGHGWNRINTAYFFDGAGLAVNTVNQLFGLDIQEFAVLDFNGAREFIDHIGGVELTLSQSEARVIGVEYSAGPILLDGAKALAHMRNRTSDSDFGRTERQREVITTILRKLLTEKTLPELLELAKYAMGMVRTNIPAGTLTALAGSLAANAGGLTIETQSIPYSDGYQNAWYNRMAILTFDIRSTGERLRSFLYG